MMFIQVKAIRKGTKPPRWRRAYEKSLLKVMSILTGMQQNPVWMTG